MEIASAGRNNWNYVRLFAVILFIEIVCEMFGYQYLGKVLFGGTWVSDTPLEHTTHLLWLLVITTPLVSTLIVRQMRRDRAYVNQVWHMAHYDQLTGLYNRRQLIEVLNKVVNNAQSSQTKLAVLFIDLDRFKNINDTLGHDIGDEVLKIVSCRLSTCVRDGDFVARFGGDEFVAVMPTIEDTKDAIVVAERILEQVQEKILCDGYEFFLTASVGIAINPTSGDTVTSLVKHADVAMYEAKRSGKNRWYLHLPSFKDQKYSRLQLENDLRNAIIERKDLYLEYQPQVEVQTGVMVGSEALIRWKHPIYGIIPPVEFIPIVEDIGLVANLGKLVLDMVCEQIKEWQALGKIVLPVGINVSQIELSQPGFAEYFVSTLESKSIPPCLIGIEITETTLMKNAENTKEVLRKLKAYGIRIMIDDFGQGYNSLGVLRQLPVDVMKIDRVFVRDIHTNLSDLSIFSALVAVGHASNLTVIAEGVEHHEQLDVLKRESCDEYQGYLFSPSLNANEFTDRFLVET